jgi:hypothetical protein
LNILYFLFLQDIRYTQSQENYCMSLADRGSKAETWRSNNALADRLCKTSLWVLRTIPFLWDTSCMRLLQLCSRTYCNHTVHKNSQVWRRRYLSHRVCRMMPQLTMTTR